MQLGPVVVFSLYARTRGIYMRVSTTRLLLLLPLVTAAVLTLPRTAPAADPVVWRTDYVAARKEAAEKGLPLLVVVGTDNCFYCRKLEAGPCRSPAVVAQLTTNFIPLKIDASREPNLAKALRIQLYPTIVLAGPDGAIHDFIEGYIEADRLTEHLKRTLNALSVADWATRDFEQANKALTSGDYPRAVTLLKGIIREQAQKPIGGKSQQLLDEIERFAAGKLVRARDLEQRGYTQEAIDVLAEAVKVYAGTQASSDAATMMSGLSIKPEMQEKLRLRTARDLLAAAKDDYRASRYYDCLLKCEQLMLFSDCAECKDGISLASDVKGNPERLSIVCEQMNQRTATMYMTLAESWLAKGQVSEAIACYEKVTRLCPNNRTGDIALSQLTRLKANGGATPINLTKPNQ
jgi:thioredoxin-like negative regulator of GroEL